MATYPTLSVGTNSEDVKKLQQALSSAGYNVSADGIYGNQTANAVKQYQQANGLTVDGIAGNQTLSKLYGGSTDSGNTQQAQQQYQQPKAPEQYNPANNAAYQQAMAQLETVKSQQPTYQDNYSDQINALFQQITNRQPFQYDAASDPLYQQYRAQMSQLGQRAMQDTMGQAAALTGGYGSSYGQAVGQQQYNQFMQRAADKIPELSDRAFQQYQAAGDQMQKQYAMLGDLRDNEYGRYRDDQSMWLNQLQMARNDADTAYDRGYNEWNMKYKVFQDQLSQQSDQRSYIMSLISSTGYNPSDAELAAAGITRAQANAMLAKYQAGLATGGSGGYYGGSGGGSSSTTTSSGKSSAYNAILGAALNAKGNSQYGSTTAANKATNDALKEAVAAGYITAAESAEIKKQASQLNRVK